MREVKFIERNESTLSFYLTQDFLFSFNGHIIRSILAIFCFKKNSMNEAAILTCSQIAIIHSQEK